MHSVAAVAAMILPNANARRFFIIEFVLVESVEFVRAAAVERSSQSTRSGVAARDGHAVCLSCFLSESILRSGSSLTSAFSAADLSTPHRSASGVSSCCCFQAAKEGLEAVATGGGCGCAAAVGPTVSSTKKTRGAEGGTEGGGTRPQSDARARP